jgi:DNA-binding NarL/FixJ family response regulator
MRNILQASARIEASRNAGKPLDIKPSGIKPSDINTERQIKDRCAAPDFERLSSQAGNGASRLPLRESIPHKIQNSSRYSPVEIRHPEDKPLKPSDRDATNTDEVPAIPQPGTGAEVDFKSGIGDTLHRDDGMQPDQAKPQKPGIAVIHQRAVFRDCFVRCLEISYRDHDIFPFATIAEWCGSEEPGARAASIVIIVIDGSDESSIAGLESLEAVAASTPVVIVSDIDDLDYIMRTFKSGARGYIPTSLPFNVAVEAMRLVKAGGTFVPASSFFLDGEGSPPSPKAEALLTARQMKVAEEVSHGKANKQIAYELNMSEHTVKVHLRHIMRKLNARNRTEVAVLSRDFFKG